jgi:DNA/RNA-binding domain of Phe-tRNA-synthetase-like protein
VTSSGEAATFPPQVEQRLGGWSLVWADLLPVDGHRKALDETFEDETERLARDWSGRELVDDPTVATIRRLFREAGCDPTRYRPSSEALLRRLRRDGVPRTPYAIVDLNNLLSLRVRAPCCVVDASAVTPPFVFRRGVEGESMDSMRGPMRLVGRPVLADGFGPFGTPISDAERVRVRAGTHRVWMVVYLPNGTASPDGIRAELDRLLGRAPVARLLAVA